MIEYLYDTIFEIEDEDYYTKWIEDVVEKYDCCIGELCYTFCSDQQLLKLNQQYLQHDTYTDIISFDYCVGDIISGEMFISIERVEDNARTLDIPLKDELDRVMIHGVLHYLGYHDKTEEEAIQMRSMEDDALSLRP